MSGRRDGVRVRGQPLAGSPRCSFVDWTLYWFMLPVGAGVATAAMASGIGGAALFMPLFLLVFPVLGPAYPFASVAAAVGAALVLELFGFTSGIAGYMRRHLVHFETGIRVLRVAVPVAVVGSLVAHWFDPDLLRVAYAALVLVLAVVLWREHGSEDQVDAQWQKDHSLHDHLEDASGETYHFHHDVTPTTVATTTVGAFLTGLISVGIGEVTVSQLSRRSGLPMPVAAGTSVFIVTVVVFASSITHVVTLVNAGGVSALPLDLLLWTVPGVVVGAQIGSRLQGRVPERTVERAVAVLFAVIGVAMVAAVVV